MGANQPSGSNNLAVSESTDRLVIFAITRVANEKSVAGCHLKPSVDCEAASHEIHVASYVPLGYLSTEKLRSPTTFPM